MVVVVVTVVVMAVVMILHYGDEINLVPSSRVKDNYVIYNSESLSMLSDPTCLYINIPILLELCKFNVNMIMLV